MAFAALQPSAAFAALQTSQPTVRFAVLVKSIVPVSAVPVE